MANEIPVLVAREYGGYGECEKCFSNRASFSIFDREAIEIHTTCDSCLPALLRELRKEASLG